jgi:hypothetical protein
MGSYRWSTIPRCFFASERSSCWTCVFSVSPIGIRPCLRLPDNFATEAGDYAAVTPFRVKMLIIVLAAISALVKEWSVPNWDRAPVMPVTARLLALVSMVLWLGAILAGVEIAPLTGLG